MSLVLLIKEYILRNTLMEKFYLNQEKMKNNALKYLHCTKMP